MADSTTHLDLIQGSQEQKEVTFNELICAMSPASVGGRRASGCSGLIWQMYGGLYRDSLTPISYGHFALTPGATNYIVAARVDGVTTKSTDSTNWDDDANFMRLYKIVTDADGVTSYEDHRSMIARVL